MVMNCKCGKLMTYSTHEVKTEKGKKNWLELRPIPDGNITIQQWVCPQCERGYYKIWDKDKLIRTIG